MEQFNEAFVAFRDRMERNLPEEFRERERSVMIAGRGCALAAGYSLSQEKKIFGMVGTGSSTHCHELRLLYSVPGLNADALPEWKEYAKTVLRERIQLDRAHEFSIFSFVLVTDAVDRAVIRALKKLDFEERYEKPDAGWAQVRFLAVDLDKGKLYPSPLGKPLVNLMHGLV